jgi:hypothetical protein
MRQGGYSFLQQDGNATSFAKRRASSSQFTTWLTGTAGGLLAEAAVTALAASQYTLNWTTVNATTRRLAVLAMGDNATQAPTVFGTRQAPVR